jgi:hypothetical protein
MVTRFRPSQIWVPEASMSMAILIRLYAGSSFQDSPHEYSRPLALQRDDKHFT